MDGPHVRLPGLHRNAPSITAVYWQLLKYRIQAGKLCLVDAVLPRRSGGCAHRDNPPLACRGSAQQRTFRPRPPHCGAADDRAVAGLGGGRVRDVRQVHVVQRWLAQDTAPAALPGCTPPPCGRWERRSGTTGRPRRPAGTAPVALPVCTPPPHDPPRRPRAGGLLL